MNAPAPVAAPDTPANSAALPSPAHWTNRLAELGPDFFTELPAQPLPDPHWVARSTDCAHSLGLPDDWWQAPSLKALDVFSGNALWHGMRPLATVYSGHQFGSWAGQLGDGRALWLGEMATPNGPMEVQLKGAGRTPYSRMGDGRAVLRSSIREFLCSEAMHALGIPTTRALCITGSHLPVQRETLETAAVVTRVAPSFLRFGHVEHFAYRQRPAALRQLADFVIQHHYPACREAAQPYAELLRAVTQRTAELLAAWQAVGFCHGVMNTDNMSLLGLTIDYGPFGFLDAFDPGHICNHSDTRGRYAFDQQPDVGLWNLYALGQALMPLIEDTEQAVAALDTFKATYTQAFGDRMRAKLGLVSEQPADPELAHGLLSLMADNHADFSITFRRLAQFRTHPGADNAVVRDLFLDRPGFDRWAVSYHQRLQGEGSVDAERAQRMNRVNPKFVLRNHLAETAIQQAQGGDFSEVNRLLKVLSHPFDEQPSTPPAYADFPPDWAQQIEVSCSS